MNEEKFTTGACKHLVALQAQYIKFLEDAYSNAYQVAHQHHYKDSEEYIEQGERMRKKIKMASSIIEDKDKTIHAIASRINSEFRKHKNLEWERIAAGKIYHQLFEEPTKIDITFHTIDSIDDLGEIQ